MNARNPAEAREDSVAVETPVRNEEWDGGRNSSDLNDGVRTHRGGTWSARGEAADPYQDSAERDLEGAERTIQTLGRQKTGEAKSGAHWHPVGLMNNSLSVEGRGQQDAITALRAFRKQQRDKVYARKASDPSAAQNISSLVAQGAGKQVQLSVKMDQALSQDNSGGKDQNMKSMDRFNLEAQVKEAEPDAKIMIQDEDRRTTMKMSETQERRGDTARNSSRASRDAAEGSLFKNSRLDKHDIAELAKTNARTGSRLERRHRAATGDNASARRHGAPGNERGSSATYRDDEHNQSILHSGFNKSSIRDMEHSLAR